MHFGSEDPNRGTEGGVAIPVTMAPNPPSGSFFTPNRMVNG